MRTHFAFAGLLALSVAAPLAAEAAVNSSVSRETFQNAVANQQVSQQNFDSLASDTILGTLAGVTYSSSTGSPLVTNAFLTSTAPNGLGRTDVGFFLRADTATFTFAVPISAFAIDINTFGDKPADYAATLNTGDAVTSFNEVFPNQTTGQFIGFVSNASFSSVTISASSSSSSPNLSYTLDTLVYGNAAAVVPEPETFALLITGLCLLGLISEWRYERRPIGAKSSL